jgi:hypothetical protein
MGMRTSRRCASWQTKIKVKVVNPAVVDSPVAVVRVAGAAADGPAVGAEAVSLAAEVAADQVAGARVSARTPGRVEKLALSALF